MTYYTIFFAVMGVLIAVGGLVALIGLGRWADKHNTPSSGVVFVVGGSGLMYAMQLGVSAAFTQEVTWRWNPTFLIIPAAFALAAVMGIMDHRKKQREPT